MMEAITVLTTDNAMMPNRRDHGVDVGLFHDIDG